MIVLPQLDKTGWPRWLSHIGPGFGRVLRSDKCVLGRPEDFVLLANSLEAIDVDDTDRQLDVHVGQECAPLPCQPETKDSPASTTIRQTVCAVSSSNQSRQMAFEKKRLLQNKAVDEKCRGQPPCIHGRVECRAVERLD